jgi:hypothetical protein
MRPSPVLLPPPTVQPHLLITLLRTDCHFTHHRQSSTSCLTRPKEAPHHHALPALRTCPLRWLAKLGNGSSPAVIFLREHPTGGSLLWLFLDPADPTVSSAPPRSSSPTTYLATSTTPSAPHWRFLPIDTRAAAEMTPPVSTPIPISAFGFSCSCM